MTARDPILISRWGLEEKPVLSGMENGMDFGSITSCNERWIG